MATKFKKEDRTFETRLKYISEIALHPKPKEEILEKCVQHRLKMNCKHYMINLEALTKNASTDNLTKVLKKLYKLK